MVSAEVIEPSGIRARSAARSSGRTIHVGCSGWQYTHWRGDFYPAELPTSRWFAQYALTFDTVEINNSFYRLPPAETFAKWREQAPPHFLYAVKASRFLTHMKKLKDPADPLARFFENAKELGSRLGPILYQLPPRWPLNLERFETFLRALPRTYRQKYGGRYPDERLDEWAEWLAACAGEGLHVFAYFNNDNGGHAPRDAVRLRQRIFERWYPPATIAADADAGASRTHAADRRVSPGVRTARR